MIMISILSMVLPSHREKIYIERKTANKISVIHYITCIITIEQGIRQRVVREIDTGCGLHLIRRNEIVPACSFGIVIPVKISEIGRFLYKFHERDFAMDKAKSDPTFIMEKQKIIDEYISQYKIEPTISCEFYFDIAHQPEYVEEVNKREQ